MNTSIQGALYSEPEYLVAKSIISEFAAEHFVDLEQYPASIRGQVFDDTFQASNIRKPNFENCRFSGVKFEGNDATTAFLLECDFDRVIFRDVCLNHSNLAASKFSAVTFENCGCTGCDFGDVKMLSSIVTGCGFMRSYFYEAEIVDTSFVHCSFEEAEFKNTRFVDADLSQAGLDYAILNSVSFIHTTLPFWGVLRSYGGLAALQLSKNTHLKYTFDSREISSSEFFSKLESMLPYFHKKKLFFELANILIFLGKQREALSCILEGLRESIQHRDLRNVRHLCELASQNRFFTKQQLRQLYDILITEDVASVMGHHEYLHYQMEIQEIKHLLVENPYGLPRIIIQIHTSICHDDYTSLAELLRYIDQSIAFYLPQSIYHISIYRNSPPLLDVSICEALSALLPYLFTFAVFVFGATNKSVSLFQDICKAHGIRLDNQEKKIHLKAAEEQEALKTEHMRLENRLLQAQIAHQEMELEKKRREIAEQDSALITTDVPNMPLEVKRQINAIEFSIQTDEPGISELRQGVLSADPQ